MACFGGSGLSDNLLRNTRTQIMCPQPRHQDSDNLLSPGVGHLDGGAHAVVNMYISRYVYSYISIHINIYKNVYMSAYGPGVGHLDGGAHAVVGIREVGSAARDFCLPLEELRRICRIAGVKVQGWKL